MSYELLGLTIGWILTSLVGLLAFSIVWKAWKNRAKTAEIINELRLAQARIAKAQEEIQQLKMETRALLKQLRVA